MRAQSLFMQLCVDRPRLLLCVYLKSLVVFPDVDGTLLFDVRSDNSHSTIFVCDNFFSYILKKKSGNNEVFSGCSWNKDSDVNAMISKIEDSLS
jgi:hypothetical protein